MKKNILSRIGLLLVIPVLQSCFNYKYVDEEAFIGTWELKGRKIYEGMQISFVENNDEIKGYIKSIPQNKYSQFFPDSANIWVSSIQRASNYAFKISEKKIASEVISQYGLSSTSKYFVLFSEDKNKIFLTDKSPNPSDQSDIYYQRVEE